MADLSDALKGGFGLDGMLRAARESDPVMGADVSARAEVGIHTLQALVSRVLAAQDKDQRIQLILAVQGDPSSMVAIGCALHARRVEALTLMGQLKRAPKISDTIRVFERLSNEQAALSASHAEESEGKFRAKVLDNLVRKTGVRGLQCPPGYEVDADGVRSDSEDVCPAPVVITGLSRLHPGNGWGVELSWARGGVWTRKYVDRLVICDAQKLIKLAQDGAPVSSANAAAVVRYLQAFESHNISRIPTTVASKRLGWVDGALLLGDASVGGDVTLVEDRGFASGYRCCGTLDAWKEAIRTHVASRPRALLGLIASCAAPMLKVLDQQGFTIDWSGDSSTGKTTTLLVAASVWGVPSERGDGLVLGWGFPSANPLADRAWFVQNLPLIVDETKKLRRPEIASEALYIMAGGQETIRSQTDGTAREPRRWHTLLLSTGESPITSFGKHAGGAARAICVSGSPFESDDGSTVVSLTEALQHNYGTFGLAWAEWLVQPENQAWARKLRDEQPDNSAGGIAGRVSMYATVLRVAGESIMRAGAPITHSQLDAVMQIVADAVGEAVERGNTPRDALSALNRWAWQNQNLFWRRAEAKQPPGGWCGRWDEPKDGADEYEYIGFEEVRVDRLLTEWGYVASDVRGAWKRNGWLMLDAEGKNPKKGPGKTRVLAIRREILDDD